EECKRLHKKGVDFYLHKHDDLLKSVPEDMRAESLVILGEVMKGLAKRGMREQADTMASSLLEIHHHLFEAREYEEAGGIVIQMVLFLNMQGLREMAKELLKKSIDSLESGEKYVAMENLASLLNDEGKWQEALDIHQECLEFFRSIDAKSQMVTTISQQALIYQERGEYEQALSLEQEGLALYEEIGNKKGMGIAHYSIAYLMYWMERYDEAQKHGGKALELDKELGNQTGIAKDLYLLGLTLNSLGRPKDAFEHFSKSLDIAEPIGDKGSQAGSLSEIGKLLLAISRQFGKALDCFQQALDIHRELGDPVKVAISLELIGFVFEMQGHYQEAL
ncbi:MAG: tetratricopeptide repeat protein, partial [Methanophagales archaeon]|nr:tetratricopeptide repeat protein [Methanophagales archaeon]